MPIDEATTLVSELEGAEVEQVWFVRDYVRLCFYRANGNLALDCLADPTVDLNGITYTFPNAGARDALCSLINLKVEAAEFVDGSTLRLFFPGDILVTVPLDQAAEFGERAVLWGPNKELFPIDAGPVKVRIKLAHPLIEEDEQQAVAAALASGQLAQGPRVAAFERAFADYVGVQHAIAVNSGTAALHVALLAHGIGFMARDGAADDEVIVPAFSFAATANCVLQAGARPVFVDVREHDFNIDTDAIAAAITPNTRAVIGVHLYGKMCDTDALKALCNRNKIALIEDAAQAVGAKFRGENAGSVGTGCFSFYATKNLTTGEGGMLTTNDPAIAERARALRSQGERTRYITEELGWNYRMTEPAAALAHLQLQKLDGRNEQRRQNAARLNELLADVEGIVTPRETLGQKHAWHQYTIRVLGGREARGSLQASLKERGIETGVFYPMPIHRQPLYQRLGYGGAEAPVAQRLCDEVLSLPVHPGLSTADVEAIALAVRQPR